jgi:hypothetical protein
VAAVFCETRGREVTTEQLIILGFLAAAFVAGWIAHALVGTARARTGSPGGLPPMSPGPAFRLPNVGFEERLRVDRRDALRSAAIDAPPARGFEGATRDSREELARANRAYHAAVVGSLRDEDGRSGQAVFEVLATALAALSGAVDHASGELDPFDPVAGKLRGTAADLRRLADDVMRHARERELPTPILDRLEQHLISAASVIFASGRPRVGTA